MLTSLIGHYIAVHIGTEMGQVIASGLAYPSKNNHPEQSEEESAEIYRKMMNRRGKLLDSWNVAELLISLPAKPLMDPLLKEVRQHQTNKLIAKTIKKEQFRTRGLIIDYSANFLNSLSLGFLVYMALRILNRHN